MKVEDIIAQMRAIVPNHTNFFSVSTTLASATQAAGTVTITTTGAHGLSVGDQVLLTGILMKTPVASLTQVGGVATVETTAFHDLTEVWQTQLTIGGANEGAYNGTFDLIAVTTTNKATFEVPPATPTPATGTIFLVENRTGYNGLVTILSTPTATTFTYAAPADFTFTGDGEVTNAKVSKDVRISGGVSLDRVVDAYTEFPKDDMWAFVVNDGMIANNSRHHDNDANYQVEDGQAYRQQLIQTFSVYVFAPSQDDIASRLQVDDMQEVRKAFFKALLAVQFDSGFCEGDKYGVTFLSDQLEESVPAYYVHRFQFQTVENINRDDIVDVKNTVAWRTFDIDAFTDFEANLSDKKVDGNLPEANS